jgi:glycosyltransferase involved in cell wall biosynthesis
MTRPIRVALLAPSLQPGGAERQMLFLARALPRPDFDVRILVMSERGSLADEAEALGVRVDVLGLGRDIFRRPSWRSPRDAGRAVMRYLSIVRSVDVVDAWLVPAYTFAGVLQPIARTPVLLAGRRSILDVKRTRTWYREAMGTFATGRVDGVVANSRAAADDAIAHEGLDPSRVHVIHNAVVPVESPPALRTELRAAWGAADGDLVVGLVGTFKPGKGQALLVEAADRLRRRCPRLRYVLVGDGPLRAQLDDDLRRRGLEDVVRIHPGEHDARRVYGAFDVAVQGSESEGLPNAVLEAAAASRPIVATAVGGTAEIITSGVDGLLVERGDAAGLAEAIARLAEDGAMRARLGEAARARAGAFSPERLAVQTGDLYRTLLAASPRRRGPRRARGRDGT